MYIYTFFCLEWPINWPPRILILAVGTHCISIRLHGVTPQLVSVGFPRAQRRLGDDPYTDAFHFLFVTDNRHCLHCGPASLPWAVTSPKSRLPILQGAVGFTMRHILLKWMKMESWKHGKEGEFIVSARSRVGILRPAGRSSRGSSFLHGLFFYVGYLTTLSVYRCTVSHIQGDRKVAHIKLNVVITCIADIIIVFPTARW
jgi:hypothetical protein